MNSEFYRIIIYFLDNNNKKGNVYDNVLFRMLMELQFYLFVDIAIHCKKNERSSHIAVIILTTLWKIY